MTKYNVVSYSGLGGVRGRFLHLLHKISFNRLFPRHTNCFRLYLFLIIWYLPRVKDHSQKLAVYKLISEWIKCSNNMESELDMWVLIEVFVQWPWSNRIRCWYFSGEPQPMRAWTVVCGLESGARWLLSLRYWHRYTDREQLWTTMLSMDAFIGVGGGTNFPILLLNKFIMDWK